MKKGVIFVVVAGFIALFWWLAARYLSLTEIQGVASRASDFTQGNKALVFGTISVLQAVGMMFALPTKAVLTLLAGALLGPALGTLCTSLGVFSGATVLFFTTRHYLREPVARRLGDLGHRIEARLTGRPIRALIGLRLFITLPFGPITMAAALSRMTYRDFIIGSLIGDTPVVIAYTIAAHRLFMLTSVTEALSPWTVGVLIAAGGFIFLTAVLGKRQGRVVPHNHA